MDRADINDNEYEKAKQYFLKTKEINFKNGALPKHPFSSSKWTLNVFQFNKDLLNSVKGKLNEFDLDTWSKHTRNTDPSSYVIGVLRKKFHIELLTQAWCKFYECLNQFNLIANTAVEKKILNSVHICEAPGAFICALNHYLELNHPGMQWKWMANTLNPNYEGNSPLQMVCDDRLIQSTTKNWHFGLDGSGDITKHYNHESIVKAIEGLGPIHLVTADGSINCMNNPGEQEVIVEHLHYCELMTALRILSIGGNFVFKIFTMFEDSTLCHLYLLKSVFKQVHFFKPATSKSGNSEVYVICLNYFRKNELLEIWDELIVPYKENLINNVAMYSRDELDKSFLKEIMECSKFFMNKQIETIERNILTFVTKQKSSKYQQLRSIKEKVAELFLYKYKIRNIPVTKRVVAEHNVSIYCSKRKISNELHNCSNYDWIYSSDLLKLNNQTDFIFIRTGRIIEDIRSSKFCTEESLESLKELMYSKNNDAKYEKSQLNLIENSFVFSKNNFNFKENFNRNLFNEVKEKLLQERKDLIFIGFPFVTTFLVGFLFLISLGFKKIVFYKNGFIHLCDASDFNKLHDNLQAISKTFDELNADNFKTDIIQVVTHSCIEQSHFYEAICNYNQHFLKNV